MVSFTIITPLYNCEDFIIETIKSVERQTYSHFELIIVDDHSSDASFEVAKKYLAHSEITYQLLKRPFELTKGVASCRNYGIEQSKGDWVCFLDSDDLFHADKLNVISDLIKSKPVNAIHHAVQLIDDKGKEIIPESIIPIKIDFKDLIKGNTIVTSSVCISRELLQARGTFDTELHGVEDYLMWLKLSKMTSWEFIDSSFTYYRVRTDSLMGARNLNYYVTENNKLFRKAKQEMDFLPEELRAFAYNLFFNTMRYYVSISLNKYGYLDFLKGIFLLLKFGRLRSALHFSYHVHKHKFLVILVDLKNKLISPVVHN